jgi:multidrug efflux system outer membrane protein
MNNPTGSRRHACLTFILFGALITGCAVGPNYKRPQVEAPATFRDDNAATNTSFADLDWWEVYHDRLLQSLIREGLTNNYDLRIAMSRVQQARASAQQARAQFMPSLDYSGAVGQGRNALFGSVFPNNGTTTGSAVATLNVFWEVDLWGRVRRLNESAMAQLLATEEARRGIRLSLLSEVATDYLQLLELDQEMEIDRSTTNSFGESLKIFTQRMEGGTATELETSRAEAALADATAAMPSTQEQISTKENELCILLGRIPGPIQRGDLSPAALPPEVPAGLPSALLERRPDVREMEQLLRSANAQVGESTAEFFPKIGLTALLGRISPQLSAFTLGGANAWGVGAEAAGPLFEGGRLVGQYRQARAARDEARLRYQQTVLTAFGEVSDALIARERLAEIRGQQSREVKALDRAVRVSTQRYLAGKASYYEVLEAQQQLFPAELNLARTKRDEMLAVVTLYKALGGGWRNESDSRNTANSR